MATETAWAMARVTREGGNKKGDGKGGKSDGDGDEEGDVRYLVVLRYLP
jgi:hypothetical protein